MNTPTCVVCHRPCIPLADYDQATCIACDDTMRTILARAGMLEPPQPPLNLTTIWRGHRVLKPCGSHAAFTRHKRRGEPIDVACDLAEGRYRRAHQAAAAARKRRTATLRITESAVTVGDSYNGTSPVRAILGATTKDGPGTACDGVTPGLTTGKGWL